MFCHKCGNKIIDGSAFCSQCGAKIILEKSVVDATQETSEETKQQNINTGNVENQGSKAVGLAGIIGSVLIRIGAIALPVFGVATLLATYPVVRTIVLAAIVIFIIVKFRHEPKKLAFGIGVILVSIAAVGALTTLFSRDKYVYK